MIVVIFIDRRFQEKFEWRNDGIDEIVVEIIIVLGGVENIEDVDVCIMCLCVLVKVFDQVSKVSFKNFGVIEVFEVGGGVQVVYGVKVIFYKNVINV